MLTKYCTNLIIFHFGEYGKCSEGQSFSLRKFVNHDLTTWHIHFGFSDIQVHTGIFPINLNCFNFRKPSMIFYDTYQILYLGTHS